LRRCIKCNEIIEDHEVICGICFVEKMMEEKKKNEQMVTI